MTPEELTNTIACLFLDANRQEPGELVIPDVAIREVIRAAEATARREEREACAIAACPFCQAGHEPVDGFHNGTFCGAAAIRARGEGAGGAA